MASRHPGWCFNPRPPHGGRHATTLTFQRTYEVSIHAPRTGGDTNWPRSWQTGKCFNPRPPHGGRPRSSSQGSTQSKFQSTPPARGATVPAEPWRWWRNCFNPRPPHGGRRKRLYRNLKRTTFQSTPPARGATRRTSLVPIYTTVSIHAPRTGGDLIVIFLVVPLCRFNPRPPHGGRLKLRLLTWQG